MADATVPFGVLCEMFQAIQRNKSSKMKRKHFRTFLNHCYTSRHYFSAVRLILPSLDRERTSYGLKESTLTTSLIEALGMSKDSPDALRLLNWRKGGASRIGPNAGNFALVAYEVLQPRQGITSRDVKIKEVNDMLDRLASAEKREEKVGVLSELVRRTNAQEMKWILMIILKDLKLGISEKTIFDEFHPDAEDLFNVTCDLKLVCERLKDRNQRNKRQDIEIGKAVRAQLAFRVSDAGAAWKKLHGKKVIAECKFDGDRVQIHKNGLQLYFFSRNFHNHMEYEPGMASIIHQSVQSDRVILDGEMLVWDTTTGRFAEFGSNQEIAKLGSNQGDDRQLCYVAFDILYVGDTSVIHQSLQERQELLRRIVKPIKGRMEILVPDHGGLNVRRSPGEPCWSIIANTLGDVEKFFKETVDNRDEGIVLKDLGSKWEPGDRSGKWLKLKPDYVHANSDLDVLVIGGYFGSGRRGGEIGQFLVGLAMTSIEGGYPSRFMSFCRVGSGLSDEELNKLVMKLKPYFKKNDNPSTKSVPCFYEVTNHSKERPDVWIDSPEKSIILSISSDIRTIKSEVFASPYSLRFPRIQRVRYDKPWYECLDVKSFVDLVQSSNGNLQSNSTVAVYSKQKKKPASRRSVLAAVPEHFIQTDVSNVVKDVESLLFKNMTFYFVNVPSSYTLDFFHKLVIENGGDFSMNLNESVTRCIAAESKGIKYQAAIRRGDVIHYSWVLDCCSGKCGVKPPRRYYVFLSESTKRKLHELGEADVLGDSYYSDVDLADIKQIFRSIDKNERSAFPRDKSEYYKKKYFGDKYRWLFSDCRVYFYEQPSPLASIKSLIDLQLRRMKFQVIVHGGEVVSKTGDATHVVIFCNSDEDVDQCETMLDNVPSDNKRLRIVRQSWLEDSVAKGRRLDENPYDLRPGYFKEGIDNFPVFPTATIEKQPTHHTKNKSVLEGPARRVINAAPTRKIAKTRRPPPRKRKSARIENESGSEVSSVSGGSKEEIFASQNMKDQDGTETNSYDQFHATLPEVRKNEGGDLVHDFMLDMVPSLAHKSDEGSTSLVRQESDRGVVGAPTEKKRKVSYKDIVDKLLKD